MTENTDTLSPALADLKAFAEAATQGPWKAEGTIYKHMAAEIRCILPGDERGIAQVWQHERGFRDARFIAAANPSVILSLLTALEEAQSGLHGVMEAGRQEIALLRARAEKAEQQAAALMNAINKTIPLLEDEGVGWIARPLIAARDKPLADVLGAALSPNKSEADNG